MRYHLKIKPSASSQNVQTYLVSKGVA